MFLVVKRNDQSAFLFETTASIPIEILTRDIAEIFNAKITLSSLLDATQDLLLHGLYKPENLHGYSISEIEANISNSDPLLNTIQVSSEGYTYIHNPDPTGRRTGHQPLLEQAKVVQDAISFTTAVLSKEYKGTLTMKILNDNFMDIKGALTILYPQGIPANDPVSEIMDCFVKNDHCFLKDQIKEPVLWWSNKQLVTPNLLSHYVGNNEKTKLIVKIQNKNQGAPVREPPMDEKAQKEMMAYWYKKQEEDKKLKEDTEDCWDASWNNSKGLKSAFNGVGDVKWKV